MPKIHPLSFIDPKAEIADDVEIGPFCFVDSDVIVGAGCVLDSHVTIKRGTTLGTNNFMAQGVVLGGDPQDRKYNDEPTYLSVGNGNTFREYVTIHRATGAGQTTIVGNDNFLMSNVHVGHNVHMHDHITIANYTGVSGHVTIEDLVTIGGIVGIHQFARIGKVAMVGGFMRVVRDIPPFMLVSGFDEEVRDINAIGLRRLGITPQSRLALHKACKLIFKSQLGLTNALEIVRREVTITPEVQYLLDFEERRTKGKNGRQDQR